MRVLFAAIAGVAAVVAAVPTNAQSNQHYGICAMSFAQGRGVHITPIFTLDRDAISRLFYESLLNDPDEVHQPGSFNRGGFQGEFLSFVESQGRSRDYDGTCYYAASAQVLKEWRSTRPSDYPTEIGLLRNWRPQESEWAVRGVEHWEAE